MSFDYSTISLQDFADAFGVNINDLPQACVDTYNTVKDELHYYVIKGEQRDKVILDVLNRIENDTQKIGSPERTDIWQKGWKENLDDFKSQKDLNALRPKYYRRLNIMRWKGDYIQPYNPNFEVAYLEVFQQWLFSYFQPYDNIYEFGCGSGINLCTLAQMYPMKNIFGSDFVPAPVELANELGKQYNNKITGFSFDMINPDYSKKILPHSAIFTSGALEQLASKTEAFFDYLFFQKPEVCIFAEPIIEVYKEDNLLDMLAMKFHRKRGYTEGILSWLIKEEAEGKVKIIKVQRQHIGSLFFEGWTVIIWKPL
jgi:hypothetical protein